MLASQETYYRDNPMAFQRSKIVEGLVISGNTFDLIERYLYVFGVWEPSITAIFRKTVRPKDVVIDIGANIGYYSLIASRLVGPHGRVVAFEPLPESAAKLARNAKENSCDVDLRDVLLGEARSVRALYKEVGGNLGHTTTLPGKDLVYECSCNVLRADDAIDSDLWPRISLVKIDAEGDEYNILQGMSELLRALRQDAVVVVEVSPELLEARGQKAVDLLAAMRAQGFGAWKIENNYMPRRVANRRPETALERISKAPADRLDILFKREPF